MQLDQREQSADGILFALRQRVEESLVLMPVVRQRDDDVVLGGEIEIERPLAHAGLSHDVGSGRVVKAIAREARERRVQNLLTARLPLSLRDLRHVPLYKLTSQSLLSLPKPIVKPRRPMGARIGRDYPTGEDSP